jgi:hypothetical protein
MEDKKEKEGFTAGLRFKGSPEVKTAGNPICKDCVQSEKAGARVKAGVGCDELYLIVDRESHLRSESALLFYNNVFDCALQNA